MGLTDSIRVGASGAADAYEIERSLRFGDADTRLRIGQSSGNQQIFTFSVWLKRSKISSGTNTISSATFNVGGQFGFYFLSDDKLQVREYNGQSNSETIDIRTSRLFRDISAWYHLVIAIDTTQGTSTNRAKVYVNGEQVTDFSTTSFPSQNQNFMVNSNFDNQRFHIGVENYAGTSNEFQGYMAEYNFIDGQQLTPSSFGETNADTGQWVPIDTSGLTFGTNGFYLNFSDNSGTSATTLGKDYSGNGNNFTPNNFSVSAGQGNDSLEDSPTNNYPILSLLQSQQPDRISNGGLDLDYTDGDNNASTVATFGMTSGKYYFEVQLRAGSSSVLSSVVGIFPDSYADLKRIDQNVWPGQNSGSGVGIDGGGDKYVNGSSSSYGSSFTTNDIVGVAVDADTGKVAFSKNGQFSNGSGSYNQGANVASGGQVSIGGTAPYFAAFADTSSSRDPKFTLNFGQRAFSHSIPSGYQKLNSQNLPEPTIAMPHEYFKTLLYTGNGGTNAISGLDFQPDWVWLKKRNGSTNHLVFDSVRGINRSLNTNGTGGEDTSSTTKLTSFNSDGFTLGSNSSGNNNGDSYVAWNWRAGTSFSNSAGSNTATIASTGSVNTTAGFSIVSYTGNATRDQKVYHGLNAVPKWILLKRRDGDNWISYHGESADSNPQQYYYEFQNQDARKGANDAFMWDDIAPDSNIFGIYSDGAVNNNGSNIIAYVFAEVAGFSRFGHYVGNSDSDGPLIYLGFRPALVIVKSNESGESWVMHDEARQEGNPIKKGLQANSSSSETDASGRYKDFIANGFKVRGTSGEHNTNGHRYIYMAWAQNPFKYARAR